MSRTTQLQEKLDDLVTLLRSTAGGGGVVADGLLQPPRPRDAHSSSREGAAPAGGVNGSGVDQNTPITCGTTAYGSPALSITSARDEVSLVEAEECLEHFRSEKLKYFPFVHIPHSLTAWHLREQRPFLWQSILASSVKSSSRQRAFGAALRAAVADKVVVQHLRSFDVLLGILGFLGWASYHLSPRPFMLMYCHLAAAIVQELGIDRPPLKCNEMHPMTLLRNHNFVIKLPSSPVRTMEERRALLAHYLVSTSSVNIFPVPFPCP